MDCQFCGTENPENAVFCKACGKRIDGLTVCPACNGLTPADGTYCTNCGARLDGKIVCKTCGSVYEGNFCPDCGTPAQKTSKKTEKRNQTEQAEENALWQKILWHVGSGFGLLTAICSLIFVFFLGCSIGDSRLVSSGLAFDFGIQDSVNLYYYFSEVYEEIDHTLNAMGYCPDIVAISMYCGAVFRTLIVAGVLIAVTVFSVLTIVRFTISYAKGTKKKIGTTAFASFLVYLAGAVLLLASNAMYVKTKVSSASIGVGVSFNGATVAGIAVCAVFAVISAACLIARRGKNLFTKKSIVNLSFTVFTLALLAAIIAVCAQPSIAFDIKSLSSTDTLSLGLLHLSEIIPAVRPNYSKTEGAFAFSFVSFAMLAALTILAVIIFIRMLSNATDGKKRTELPLAIAAFVVSLICMIFAILAANDFVEIYRGASSTLASSMEASYAGVIVVFVLSALILIAAIVHQTIKFLMKNRS